MEKPLQLKSNAAISSQKSQIEEKTRQNASDLISDTQRAQFEKKSKKKTRQNASDLSLAHCGRTLQVQWRKPSVPSFGDELCFDGEDLERTEKN